MSRERFSHQIFHHGAQAKASAAQVTAAMRYARPALADNDTSGSLRKRALKRTNLDWQSQLLARRQHFSVQSAHLARMRQSQDSAVEDGMFSPAGLVVTPSAPGLSPEMLAAAPAAGTVHWCSTGAHPDKSAQNEEPPHEHSGFIAVDLDEAAHGAYASSKYLGDALTGKPEQLVAAVREDASLLASAPREALSKEALPHGVADFSAAAGASAAMLPLAGMAIYGGVHEMNHARGTLRALAKEEDLLKEDMRRATVLKNVIPGAVDELALAARGRKRVGFARKLARLDFGIGLSSALSGAAIFVKSTLDIGLKSALVAVQKKFALADAAHQGAQIGTAGLVAGAAGTLVLSPLAGLFAATLGMFFVRKSTAKHRQLKQDVALARQHLQTNLALLQTAGRHEARHAAFQSFITRQADKRVGFFRRFRRWNKAFLVGSGLYAASATTKMAVSAAALAGLGAAASNPVGLGILLAVGITGALIMGGASLSFLRGHDKQGRFSRHTSEDHPEVDRDMLASLDLLRRLSESGATDPAAAFDWSVMGVDARARCLQRLDSRKLALDTFLKYASTHHGKVAPGEPSLHVWNKLGTQLRTGWRYAAALVRTGSREQASRAAQHVRMACRSDLGSRQVEMWMQKPDGETAFLAFARQDIQAKADYLLHKLRLRLDLAARSAGLPDTPDGNVTQSLLDAYAEHAGRQDGLIEKDQAELERCRALLAQIDARDGTLSAAAESIEAIAATAGEHDRIMANLRDYFGGESSDDATVQPSAERVLSKLVTGKLKTDLKDARGILFETQLQASRIREESIRTATASATAPAAKPGSWFRFGRKAASPDVPDAGSGAPRSL